MAPTTPVRRAERARASLEYLAEHADVDEYRPISEVWNSILRSVPFTDHEAELTSKGRPRGEADWRWASADLAAAGWLR
uniref:hypothetical protein n=1 Tax=Streptomyces sp. GbtcB7 TaxID=2824752 RepID=UPI001C30D9D3